MELTEIVNSEEHYVGTQDGNEIYCTSDGMFVYGNPVHGYFVMKTSDDE